MRELDGVDDLGPEPRVALFEDHEAREGAEGVEVGVVGSVDAAAVAEREAVFVGGVPGESDVGEEAQVVPVDHAGLGAAVEHAEVAEGTRLFGAQARAQREGLALAGGGVRAEVARVRDVGRGDGLVVEEAVGSVVGELALAPAHLEEAEGVVGDDARVARASPEASPEARASVVGARGVDVDLGGGVEGEFDARVPHLPIRAEVLAREPRRGVPPEGAVVEVDVEGLSLGAGVAVVGVSGEVDLLPLLRTARDQDRVDDPGGVRAGESGAVVVGGVAVVDVRARLQAEGVLVAEGVVGAELEVAAAVEGLLDDVVVDGEAALDAFEDVGPVIAAGVRAPGSEGVEAAAAVVDGGRDRAARVAPPRERRGDGAIGTPRLVFLEPDVDDAGVALGLVLGPGVGDDVDAVDLLGR